MQIIGLVLLVAVVFYGFSEREVALAFDSWTRSIMTTRGFNDPQVKRLLQLAIATDPDPYRVELRKAGHATVHYPVHIQRLTHWTGDAIRLPREDAPRCHLRSRSR